MLGTKQTSLLALAFLAATAGGGWLALGGVAEAPLDTSRLPRVAGAKETFASPASSIYTAPGSVAQTAEAVAKALGAAGWRQYTAPFGAQAETPTMRTMSFKKGASAITAFITVAPAQGGATSVGYSGAPLANDLPFPSEASNIAFDPNKPYLAFSSSAAIDETLEFFRKELVSRGWSPWSAKDGAKAAGAGEKTEKGAHAYYVRENQRPLLLLLQQGEGGRTTVKLEAVPAELLTAQSKPKEPAPAAPAAAPTASAKAIDALADEIADQARRAAQDAAAQALAGVSGAAAPAAPTASPGQVDPRDLEAEETGGFPVPKRRTSSGSERTPFRRELTASAPVELADVLAFYRRELGARGWKEERRSVASDRAELTFASPEGPAVLTLDRKGAETIVKLALRNRAGAQKAGVLPKVGKAKLLLGNVTEADAVVTIDKKSIKVGAGVGAKAPDGPTLDLTPGKYKYALKAAGAASRSEEVEVGADETWGLLIGPGGALPLRVY